MVREGREPRIQDIFSHMRLFLPLFLLGLVFFIVTIIGFALFVLPGFLILLAIAFGCLYVLPLMTDKGLGVVEAIRESVRMSTGKNTLDQIVIMIVYVGLCSVGGSVFIGWLFTQPFATAFLLSVYEEKIKSPARVESSPKA
jgi:membrane-anchored glycerophosphoryl diester phosphodiesterase (GDPDase)